MFKSARLKLTGWYLAIIMLISVSFSGVIYLRMAKELERGFRRAELRFKAEELDISLPRRFSDRHEDLPPRLREITPPFLFVEDFQAAKKSLALNLLMINGTILIISAGAGYFLAGKTLKPIEIAMEEQKRFVADASHELRTPLSALKTSIEVALKDKKMAAKEARKVLASNLEEVDHLQSLSDDLLSLASHQNNNNNLSFKKVGLKKIIENAYKKIKPLAKKKNIKAVIDLGTKDLALQGDEKSLEKVVLIFLDNAVKYTPDGGKVTVAARPDKKNVLIKIKDAGIGIPKKDLPHIFERFYRVDQSRTKTKIDGFGLGLSMAKKIIELHKGSIKAESILGKGTSFTIKLPL